MGIQARSIFVPVVARISPPDEKWGDLRDWHNIPPVVCITLLVPRSKLSVLTKIDHDKLGTPTVQCLLQPGHSLPDIPRESVFLACRLAFGSVSTRGRPHDDSFEVSVTEDQQGWGGNSALVVSFYVSSFHLLLGPQKGVVAFGLHVTPASLFTFGSKLGLELNVYKTTLDNSSNVFITRHSPNLTGFPIVPGFSQTDLVASGALHVGADTSSIVHVNPAESHIASFTTRLNVTSEDYKAALNNRCEVQNKVLSPCQRAIALGQKLAFVVNYPTFVRENTCRTRIFRKSSRIEVVAEVATSSAWMDYPYFLYPVFLQDNKPVNWNMPNINLDLCPVIDINQREQLDWLNPHISLAMSARERGLYEDQELSRSDGEKIRLDFKVTLFHLFIRFVGLQGEKHQVFGFTNVANGGIKALVLASTIRIDTGNRVVVLDCAILPLHQEIMPKLRKFLAVLSSQGLCQVKVNDAELHLWKHVLPAYVERCRIWDHNADCEYAKAGKIPLNMENEKQFLCSCGNGHFPPNFINGIAHWEEASRYAVRAAISPAFWAPYADDIYRGDARRGDDRCAKCGVTQKKGGGSLLRCAKCKKAWYCSRKCQAADYPRHKGACKQEGAKSTA